MKKFFMFSSFVLASTVLFSGHASASALLKPMVCSPRDSDPSVVFQVYLYGAVPTPANPRPQIEIPDNSAGSAYGIFAPNSGASDRELGIRTSKMGLVGTPGHPSKVAYSFEFFDSNGKSTGESLSIYPWVAVGRGMSGSFFIQGDSTATPMECDEAPNGPNPSNPYPVPGPGMSGHN